jgi:hypothetical protein
MQYHQVQGTVCSILTTSRDHLAIDDAQDLFCVAQKP